MASTGTAGADPLSVWQCASLYPSTSPYTAGSVGGYGCDGSGVSAGDFVDSNGVRLYRCRQFSYTSTPGAILGTNCTEYEDS